MWGGQLWFSSMMGEEQKSEETHSAFVEMPIYGLESTTKMGVLKEILHTKGEKKILNMYVLGLEKKELYCMYYT